MIFRFVFVLILSICFGATSLAAPPSPAQPLAPKALQNYLEQTDSKSHPPISKDALLTALKSVSAHGLNPEDYHLDTLNNKGTGDDMMGYAVDAWMSAASHIAFGKVSPTSVEPDWTAKGRQADLMRHFRGALDGGTLASSLDRLAPQHEAYQSLHRDLKARLAQQDIIVKPIPAGETLKRSMQTDRVNALQNRLSVPQTGVFNQATEDAVIQFQNQTGLDADGVVGPATLRALNRNGAALIDQLRVNLERWRWLEDDLGTRHIRVNIADFSVQAWKDGQIERVHAAIVGKNFRKTPVFSDTIKYVVLNPWWETPASLARRDKLPAFQKDPSSVQRLGFQVLDRNGTVLDATKIDWKSVPAGTMPYRLRQAPGDQNALGEVKIMFPNKHNVYLHDTPTRGLFAQRQRAFSSGCIRTQDPIDLTEWLLSETTGWERSKIDMALATKKETRANLSHPVPVHILYMTAVNEGSAIRFVDDIYDRDAALLAGLNRQSASR